MTQANLKKLKVRIDETNDDTPKKVRRLVNREKRSGLTRPDFCSNLIDFKKKFNIKRLWAQQTRFALKSNTLQ